MVLKFHFAKFALIKSTKNLFSTKFTFIKCALIKSALIWFRRERERERESDRSRILRISYTQLHYLFVYKIRKEREQRLKNIKRILTKKIFMFCSHRLIQTMQQIRLTLYTHMYVSVYKDCPSSEHNYL